MQEFDVIIVGGGMVGASLALAVSETVSGSGLRVAIVDRQSMTAEPVTPETSYAPRVSALTEASVELFRKLGAWRLMQEQRVCAYEHMQVWDGEGTGEIQFDADSTGYPALGYIVENDVIRSALLQRLDETDIQLYPNQRKLRFHLDDDLRKVILENDEVLAAPLLVAADGAESTLRSAAAIPVSRKDYLHHAVVTTVITEKSHQNSARQVFLDTGPLAFLPLPDLNGRHCSSIVWSLVPEEAEQVMALSDEAFCQSLARAIEARLGNVIEADARLCFPLQQRHASQYHRSGVVLVGDAAHTIHPLAGQGVNLGLQDAIALAEELLRAVAREDDIATDHILNRYQRRRKGSNLAMILTMEGFQNLFSQNDIGVRWLRNTGLKLTDRLPLIKQLLIKQAMGLNS
ncbi:MAG: FAD-dependent monooxygenase [Endozoicomonas sp.]